MSYYIYSDVSLDMDRELARTEEIRFVPMEYIVGGDTFRCTELQSDETMHGFYDRLRQKQQTRTSQITPVHYMETFEPLVKEGKGLIYLCLSSGLSNTYSSASLAAQELREKYGEAHLEIVDTLGATGGMGLLAEMAAKNRAAGMSLEENAAFLREHALDIQYWFKVEDLMYLHRGGRVSSATAIVGTALNIKPILMINEQGRLDTIDKKRGNKQAVKNMIERFEDCYAPELGTTVYLCCADCIGASEKLKAELLRRHPELTVHVTMLSPIIGAHTGPDMMSLIHFGTGRRKG